MKKLIMYHGKYFCLMLGIFLFASCVPVFGQDLAEKSVNSIDKLIKDIQDVELKLSVFYEKLQDPNDFMEKHIEKNDKLPERIGRTVKDHIEKLRCLSYEYAERYARYDYYCKISDYIIKEGTLAELSRPYLDLAFTENIAMDLKSQEFNVVFEMLPEKLIDRVVKGSINPKTQYFKDYTSYSQYVLSMEKTDVEQAKKAIKYMQGKINEMKEGIAHIEQAKAELLRQKYTPVQIMEYAFKHMPEAERAAFGLAFTARDVAIPIERQAEGIIKYVEAYGKGLTDPKYFSSVDDLVAELKTLSPLERIEYTDEIAGLKSNKGAQKFVADYDGLSTLEKRVVRKGAQRVWGLTALVAVATAAYIVDIAADNHFNSGYTMSNRDLATIGKKIENGTANFKERFAFFRSPSTKKLVETDPVYTLSLVQLARDIYAADELLKEVQKTQGQQIKENVENGVLKNLNQKMSTTDFGVGTL